MDNQIQTSILKYVSSYASSDSDSEDSYPPSSTSCSRCTSDSESHNNKATCVSGRMNCSTSATPQSAMDFPCSLEAGDVSNLTDDPSLPLPSDVNERYVCIRKGPYQPRLRNYKITTHNGKKRTYCSKWYGIHSWLEYSPVMDRMYCFVCRAFGHRVTGPGSVGKVDPAFTQTGTQGQQWKKARNTLSRHQSCFVYKQSSLSYADFQTCNPISIQLDQVAARNMSRLQKNKKKTENFISYN